MYTIKPININAKPAKYSKVKCSLNRYAPAITANTLDVNKDKFSNVESAPTKKNYINPHIKSQTASKTIVSVFTNVLQIKCT